MRIALPRSFIPGLALAGIGAAATFVTHAQTPAPGPLAPEKYKNIQVLTDVPARQVLGTMDYIAAATGHGCVDCHQRGKPGEPLQYEIDTPLKAKAREMIRMTKAINAGNFGVTVSCGTCHSGHAKPPGLEMMTPERWAPLAAAITAAAARASSGGQPAAPGAPNTAPQPAPEPAPPAPATDAILAKYYDAVGGRAALDAMPATFTTAAIVNVDTPQKGEITIDRQAEKFIATIRVPPSPQVGIIGFDGKDGWTSNGTTVLDAQERALQRMQHYAGSVLTPGTFGSLGHLTAGSPTTLRVTPSASPVAVNVLVLNEGPDVVEHLYFDAATGLLLRRVLTTHVALGGTLEEWFDYADYQPFAGVRIPRSVTTTTSGVITSFTVTGLRASTTTDAARFARPKSGGH